MNRKCCIIIIGCVLFCLLAAVLRYALFGAGGQSDRREIAERLSSAAELRDSYTVKAVFRPDEGTLAVTQDIAFQNRTGGSLADIVLRFYASAYASEDTAPGATEELFTDSYGGSFSAGGCSLMGVWADGAAVQTEWLDAAETALSVPVSLDAGQECALTLRYVLSIPECAHRFGVSDGVYRFLDALAVIAPYADGAWRTEEYSSVGEPFMVSCADYDVTLNLPEGYMALGSGFSREDGAYHAAVTGARGFAFVILSKEDLVTLSVQGVTLRAPKSRKKTVDTLKNALNSLVKLYGDLPQDALDVCVTAYALDFGSYSGLIILDADADETALLRAAARQWFGVLVGSDGYEQAWLSGALSEWAMLRCVRQTQGQDAFERLKKELVDEPMRENITASVTAGSPVDYFPDRATYDAVVRGRGAAYLFALDEMTGGRTDEFLRALCGHYAYALLSRETFEADMNGFSDKDIVPLALDYLDTYMD